jgi:hypothetical protein
VESFIVRCGRVRDPGEVVEHVGLPALVDQPLPERSIGPVHAELAGADSAAVAEELARVRDERHRELPRQRLGSPHGLLSR